MATFNIFSSIEDYKNALGTNPVSTQDFESFVNGTDLDGVEFISGISATSNLPRVEVFKGSGDKELFILDRRSVSDDSFYQINFSESYNAVGFDIESFNPVTPGPAVLDIEFADGENTSVEIFPTNPTESDPIFFGIVADKAIAKIRLTEGPEVNGIGNEEIALDNFIVANIPDSSQQQEIASSFEIDSPNSVPYEIFNVLVPGTIEVEIELEEGNSEELTVSLEGKRRPKLADPTAPYAQVSGSTSIKLTYDVTKEDIARGVSWRLVVDGEGNKGFKGNIKITTPFDPEVDRIFQQQKISLRSGDLLPTGLEDEFLDELELVDNAKDERLEGLHGIITVNRTPEHDELLKLEKAGINRQSFLPNKHAFGFVDRDVDFSDPNIARLVRSFTPLEPEDKIAPDILVGNYQKYFVDEIDENYVLNDDGSLSLSVLFARDTSLEDIRSILKQQAISFSPLTDNLWEVNIEAENLINLATYDRVEWIDPGSYPDLPENSNTRPVTNVDDVQDAQVDGSGNLILSGGFPIYDGLSGDGITVGVDDNGIDASHPDLNVVADRPASRSHGTHVAGIIAADGQNSNGTVVNRTDVWGTTVYGTLTGTPFQWRGVAPNAGLIDSGNLINSANVLNAIQNNSLDVSNQSETISVNGDYDSENQTIDQLISGGATSGGVNIPRRPKVVSAGNNGERGRNGSNQSGYFSISKQIKNAVVVGNWDTSDQSTNGDGNINNDVLHFTGSLGPTHDGRLKPDVVAPGSSVISTNAFTNGYRSNTGTSMASPVVAGIHALLLEGWQNTYSTPLGTTIDERPPLPSTLRALLIQTAVDIVDNDVRSDDPTTLLDERQLSDIDSDNNRINGNDGLGRVTATVGPDYATGWGLVDAEAAVELMQDFRQLDGVPIPNRIIQDAVMHDGIIDYDFVVDQDFIDSGDPLTLTLAWDDFESAIQNPATNPMLVNDLDLELIAPDGTIFYPWQLGHTILDASGNPLPDNAQAPGTAIQINRTITPTATPATSSDYIPANALTGNGDWVARRGKDHLNNVEQVLVDSADLQTGHWQARVIGFDVQAGTAQDYSLVGFPYPDLPDLVAFSNDKVSLPAGGGTINFDWTVRNIGSLPTGSDFEYQVLLSNDFFADASDVVLTDTNQATLGALNVGGTLNRTSQVTINNSHAQQLLGSPTATVDDLIDNDAFLLVQVDSNDDILEHNEENTTFIQLSRLVDVVLVMDRSGSMASEVPVSSGSRPKIELLQDSANLFLDLIRLDAGDRLGEVSFAGDVTTDFGPGDVLTEITSTNINDAKDEVNNLSPSGSTNIRGALQEGLDLLTVAPDGDERRQVVVFLSDGMPTTGGDPTDPTFLQQFDDEDVKVFSVGFGTEGASGNAGIDVDLLETLTNVGSQGFYQVTESALELDKFFVNAVAGAIGSDVIVDPIDDINPGETHTVDITLGEQDSVASFILTSDNPQFPLDLALRTPSGLEINQGNFNSFGDRISYIDAPTHDIYQVHLPIAAQANTDHAETWEMVIRNPNSETVTYSASALAQSSVHLDFLPPQSGDGIFNSGEPIPLQLFLRENNQVPIREATVTVSVTAPRENLGNLLSSGVVTREDLAKVPVEIKGEPLGVRERMAIALQEKFGENENPLSSIKLNPIELKESDEGYYSSRFTNTKIPGTYTFVVNVEGFTSDWQPFQRETTYTVNVSDEVDQQKTRVKVTNPSSGIVGVTILPVTTAGNLVGPGFENDIQVEGKGLKVVTPWRDNLDGSYTQIYEVNSNIEKTELNIEVLDVQLPPVAVDTGISDPGTIIDPIGGRGVLDNTIVGQISNRGISFNALSLESANADESTTVDTGISESEIIPDSTVEESLVSDDSTTANETISDEIILDSTVEESLVSDDSTTANETISDEIILDSTVEESLISEDSTTANETISQPEIIIDSIGEENIISDGVVEGIDLTTFATDKVTVDYTISRESDFDNQVYFYAVDDLTGSIDGVAVSEDNYIETALNNLVSPVFSTSDDNTETGSVEFDAGSIILPVIIADGTLNEALSGDAEVYLPFSGANSDNFDHIKLLDNNTFGFEDLLNGGDQDFNDIQITINSIA